MSGISSVSSSTSSSYYSPLDTNKDGVVDAQELQAAGKSGLLSASVKSDEGSDDDSSSASPTDAFSGNLIGMILQQMQQAASATSTSSDASSSDTSNSSSQSSIDTLFKNLDTNGDGKVSADEFVAGRPDSMSENEASALFKSLDQQDSGSLDQTQFTDGVNSLTSQTAATSDSNTASTELSPLETFLQEMQASLAAYENSYGQYDFGSAAADLTGVAA